MRGKLQTTGHFQSPKRTQDAIPKVIKHSELNMVHAARNQSLRPFSGGHSSRNSRFVDDLLRTTSSINRREFNKYENRARPEHIRFSQTVSDTDAEGRGPTGLDSEIEFQQLSPTRQFTLRRNLRDQPWALSAGKERRQVKKKDRNPTFEDFDSDTDGLADDQDFPNDKRASQATTTITECHIPSTALLYDQLHVHRISHGFVSVVQPMEVFKTLRLYKRTKVLGFVRHNGLPLIYSLSGSKVCVETHPKMLDSEVWTKEVKFWAKAHNIKFQTYIWDYRHGSKTFFASHAELRLIMWFAVDLKFKITGTQPATLREQIGDTFRLRTLTEGVEAEVVLTKAPCPSCLKFAATFEEYTGLRFSFTVIGNVGPLRVGKDKHNFATLDGFASLSESEDSESDFETTLRKAVRYSQQKSESLQVVIREKAATEVDVQINIDNRGLQARPHCQNSKRARFLPQAEDDSEFEPPGKKSKPKAKINNIPTTPTRPISGRNTAPPPSRDDLHDEPFGLEARAFAEQFKKGKPKKRKREDAYPSPISAKKKTRHKYFDM